MYIEEHYGSGEIQTEYYNQRLEAMAAKKIQSAFTSILNFIKDFFLLFISCFLLCFRKNKNKEEIEDIKEGKMQIIINFFLQKMGRVDVEADQNIYQL